MDAPDKECGDGRQPVCADRVVAPSGIAEDAVMQDREDKDGSCGGGGEAGLMHCSDDGDAGEEGPGKQSGGKGDGALIPEDQRGGAPERGEPQDGISVNPAICSGGSGATNIIPDHAELIVSFRVFTRQQIDQIKAKLSSLASAPFDPRVHVEVIPHGIARPGMTPTSATKVLMDCMKTLGDEMGYHVGFTSSGGGSDANEAAEHCATVCACGPHGFRAHTVEEYIRVSSIEPRLRYMTALMERLFVEPSAK